MLSMHQKTKRLVGKALSERTQDLKYDQAVKLICRCGKLCGYVYGVEFAAPDGFIIAMCGSNNCRKENEFKE